MVGFSLWGPSVAAPVTYEVGGTFVGGGSTPIPVPFEGEQYTFQFTYDAEKMETAVELWGTLGIYEGGLSNFRFSTTVDGKAYEFTMPNNYPGTENSLGRIGKYDNLEEPERGLVDVVQAGSFLPNNFEPQFVDTVPGIDGFFPRGLALNFVSYLGFEGQDGFDFVSSLGPGFDPIALAELEGYGSLSDYNREPGDGYKGISLHFVSAFILYHLKFSSKRAISIPMPQG
jgi:hypothetical protein